MSDEMDYLKLQNDYIVLKSEYDAAINRAESYKIERDVAIQRIRKYAHATKLILSAKNMLEMACDYLEVDDD